RQMCIRDRSAPASDPMLGATADQIGIQRGVEDQLTAKVQSLLETVLGPGKAVVRIAAEMDFQKAERTIESYDAENPVVRSEERSEETSADGGRSESSTTNYEISKTIEHVSVPTGTIRRLTASVFVDGTYRALPKGQKEYLPRSAEEMQKFENIIKTALGFTAGRGDLLTVENIAFDTSVLEQERKEMEKADRFQLVSQLGGKLLTGVVVAGLFLFLLRAFRRMRTVEISGTPSAAGRHLDLTVGGETIALPEKLENPRSVQVQKRLQELSRSSPDNLAKLIRVWLREEEA
ncbi:MAG: flagellar M-ring protein FliF C-terminal domain-containing protein, partial [Candidatus Eisenbacteria bacterium]|nr:flagellar M-ring protein FliF C-terminal domain-containing protein [Candidatus Eisenbacteria bacterium]